ncbi:MAG: efflux RND transporter periplasmic adaptor subunit [Pseudomonadota bacterium]|nr:efflux RND transporter periplasmic adaptor subunit [Pseudomonadota bacterium]
MDGSRNFYVRLSAALIASPLSKSTMPNVFLLVITAAILMTTACTEQAAPIEKTAKPHLVEIITAQSQTLTIERQRNGTLKALREIQIYNQEEGQITALPFYENDRVKKDDIVAKLDDRLLMAQLERTQALRRKAEQDLLRFKNLAAKGLTPQTEITRVETELAVAKADEHALLTRIDFTVIRAPISGIVSERHSEQGNIAERYSHLLTLSDQSSLITEVAVSELLINKLHVGDKPRFSIDALGIIAPPLHGTITRIYPNLDPFTRTGTVEITLKPVPTGARPGQLVRVTLKTEQAKRLLIPFTSLRHSTQGDYVFTIDSEQKAQRTPVVTGLNVNDQVEIVSGLSEGAAIVVRGYTNLHANKEVTVVNVPALAEQTPNE